MELLSGICVQAWSAHELNPTLIDIIQIQPRQRLQESYEPNKIREREGDTLFNSLNVTLVGVIFEALKFNFLDMAAVFALDESEASLDLVARRPWMLELHYRGLAMVVAGDNSKILPFAVA